MHDVCVVIPCFNAGPYLEPCIRSVLEQKGSVELKEIIIVDDRSNDETTLEALGRVQADSRVRVIPNTGPRGSAAARNEGVRKARARWIAFLDADDWWPEDSLVSRFAALDEFPDAEWIGGDFLELNRDGSWEAMGRFERNLAIYDFLAPGYRGGRTPVRLDLPLHDFLKQAPCNPTTTLLTKALFNRVGGFDERLLRQQDYHMFLRLAASSPFVFVPRVIAFNRQHDSNSTRSLTDTQNWRIVALESLSLTPDFSTVRNILKERICHLHISNSYEFRRSGQFSDAARSGWKAIRANPLAERGWNTFIASLLQRH